jgi:hypothetical protein
MVTVKLDSNSIVFDFYVFDVSGITIPPKPCTASGSSLTSSISTTSSCPTSGYFLIATFGTAGTDTPTNCDYPASSYSCQSADGFMTSWLHDTTTFSIYSTSGVPPPTTYFPATLPTPDSWIEVAAAFTC